jgi:hypothetical protein
MPPRNCHVTGAAGLAPYRRGSSLVRTPVIEALDRL